MTKTTTAPTTTAQDVAEIDAMLTTASILNKKAKQATIVQNAKALDSAMRMDKAFNAFIENPLKAIPKNFRTVEDAEKNINTWLNAIKGHGEIEPKQKLKLLQDIIDGDVAFEVGSLRNKLTTRKQIPLKLNKAQHEEFEAALLKFTLGIKVITNRIVPLYAKKMGYLPDPEVVVEQAPDETTAPETPVETVETQQQGEVA